MSSEARDDVEVWARLYELPIASLTLEPATVPALFRDAVSKAPDAVAVRYCDTELSYGQLDEHSDRLATWFGESGVAHGDRVVILLQNVPEFVVAVLAAWKVGGIPVPVNPMYRGKELGRIIADADPKLVVCLGEDIAPISFDCEVAHFLAVGRAVAERNQTVSVRTDVTPWKKALASQRTISAASDSPDSTGLLMYTSGTTGTPKGAQLSHRAIAYNARMSSVWLQHGASSRILAIAPFFHITGFVLQLASAMECGAEVLLAGRPNPDNLIALIRAHRPTHTSGTITIFNALMNVSGVERSDFDSFVRVACGGAPIPPALKTEILRRTGLNLCPGYGMTETCGPTHFAPFGHDVPVDPDTGALSIGIPVPGVEARLEDEEGRVVVSGKRGELLVRGPQVMHGYWRRPAETQAVLDDGWIRTGDVAVMDDAGWFYLVDRKKDVIIASGFKVWPREVEDQLYDIPEILEAAVIGKPDAYRGESPVAFVSLVPGSSLSTDDVIAHCRANLAAYKVPREVVILPGLPKTPSGKIQRALLR